MKGQVRFINHRRGMVAVLTERQDFSIVELLGHDTLEVGDRVSWSNHMHLGGGWLTNHTQGRQLEVCFQNHFLHVSQVLLSPFFAPGLRLVNSIA